MKAGVGGSVDSARAMVRIVNLTPHPVTVDPGGPAAITLPPTGVIARVRESKGDVRWLVLADGPVPVQSVSYLDQIEGLAAPQDGVLYLVSRVTAAAIDRPDLVFPQDEVRNEHGQIIGCRVLGTFTTVDHMKGA